MNAKDRPSRFYVWLDTEYTSLDLFEARILQLAAMITTPDLQRVTSPQEDLQISIALAPNQVISEWVEKNIPAVVAACRGPDAVPILELDFHLCAFLDAKVGATAAEVSARPILAGNSLHADWFLLKRFAPRFVQRLHYRMLDVTALKLQWLDFFGGAPFEKDQPQNLLKYFPGAHLPKDLAPHHAYYDIQASAAELGFYRAHLARPSA